MIATYATGDGARKVDFSAGAAWVTNQDVGTVTRIDARTGAQRSFATHHTVSSAAAGAGRVLVEVDDGRSYVEDLDALKGSVARLDRADLRLRSARPRARAQTRSPSRPSRRRSPGC